MYLSIEFVVISLLSIVAAWALPAKNMATFLAGWLAVVSTYCYAFWDSHEFWLLLPPLVEIVGVTYLANEVRLGQVLEEYKVAVKNVKRTIEAELQKIDQLIETQKQRVTENEEVRADLLPEYSNEIEEWKAGLAQSIEERSQIARNGEAQLARLMERLEASEALSFSIRRGKLFAGVTLTLLGLVSHELLKL